MEVCLNGMRTAASVDINKLGQFILDNKESFESIRAFDLERFIQLYDAVAQNSAIANCVYSEKEEKFDDISDKVSLVRLEVDENDLVQEVIL